MAATYNHAIKSKDRLGFASTKCEENISYPKDMKILIDFTDKFIKKLEGPPYSDGRNQTICLVAAKDDPICQPLRHKSPLEYDALELSE